METNLWLIKNVKNELVDLSLVPFDGDLFYSASGLVESKHCLKIRLTHMCCAFHLFHMFFCVECILP